MVGASKILTVSYGTFSCTLEGFDDPFSTMKAIAEYFRELAAEDRYFGAEPPTPDAEMLHKIAEREIQRRVEAKIEANGVVLRQEEGSAVETPPRVTMGAASAPSPVMAESELAGTKAAGMPAPADTTLRPVEAKIPAAVVPPATDDGEEDTPAIRPVAASDAESVAAKLMRIRAAVAGSRTATATDAVEEPAAAEAAAAAAAPEEPVEAEPEAETDDAAPFAAAEADDEAMLLGSLAAALTQEESVAAADQPQAEALTIDGQNDEAEEEDWTAEGEDWPAESEDWPAEGFAPLEAAEAQEAEIAALTELTRDLDATDAEPVMPERAESTDLGFVAAGVWPDATLKDDGQDDLPDALSERLAADMFASVRLSSETGPAGQGGDPASADEAHDLSDEAPAPEEALPETTIAEPQPQIRTEHALQRARARVIKVRRVELGDAEPAPQPVPEPAADAMLSGIGAALGDTGLSAEDEADLMAELAAVEREVAGPRGADAPTPPARAEEARTPDPAAVAPRQSQIEDAEIVSADTEAGRPALGRGPADEAAVSRLIETANTRLQGSETRRRFSAIAHLKAAVAATVADRALQSQAAGTALAQDSEEAIDRYRDDLTKAVRPRRPGEDAGAATQTPRPGTNREQAPLVLVSEQRVDRGAATQPQEVGAIRPRRVTTSTLRLTEMIDSGEDEDDLPAPTPEEARSFAGFAERLGANGLADLLEAAAAYTAAIEGRPHFSRPQIIKKVAHLAEEADYSREASLRSFGMLLREGKIQKVKRGQFAISDNSRFMSEARRAAR
ncbi:hypothetical protein [Frigidibacter mobilis]|uniref:Lipoprotein n=1 Tax=Frigidibacter mobilis TaxID=1335048 RepID=A0A159Z4A1_9RHOB|nr:hypothetical protein [Frigidibacter mobilis]AMY69981.1 lipoprotein [Frigidibacter mobilis]